MGITEEIRDTQNIEVAKPTTSKVLPGISSIRNTAKIGVINPEEKNKKKSEITKTRTIVLM